MRYGYYRYSSIAYSSYSAPYSYSCTAPYSYSYSYSYSCSYSYSATPHRTSVTRRISATPERSVIKSGAYAIRALPDLCLPIVSGASRAP